ncbi:hypothetical protein ACIBG4_32385 [Nonomuraea sp. NPDC050383]|uniref:hypothetical protein n=1 Tax=Nonomuraea sp. NPDC050383 TaxID=3364362 RepID=UPI0037A7D053
MTASATTASSLAGAASTGSEAPATSRAGELIAVPTAGVDELLDHAYGGAARGKYRVAEAAQALHQILAADALNPWHYQSWVFIRDPDFAAKATRVLDLYQRIWDGRPFADDEEGRRPAGATAFTVPMRVEVL